MELGRTLGRCARCSTRHHDAATSTAMTMVRSGRVRARPRAAHRRRLHDSDPMVTRGDDLRPRGRSRARGGDDCPTLRTTMVSGSRFTPRDDGPMSVPNEELPGVIRKRDNPVVKHVCEAAPAGSISRFLVRSLSLAQDAAPFRRPVSTFASPRAHRDRRRDLLGGRILETICGARLNRSDLPSCLRVVVAERGSAAARQALGASPSSFAATPRSCCRAARMWPGVLMMAARRRVGSRGSRARTGWTPVARPLGAASTSQSTTTSAR